MISMTTFQSWRYNYSLQQGQVPTGNGSTSYPPLSHTHTLSLSDTCTLSPSLLPPHTVTYPLSPSLLPPHTVTYPLSPSLPLSSLLTQSHTHSLPLSSLLTQSHTHSLPLSLSPPSSHSHIPTLSLSPPSSHSHIPTLSLSPPSSHSHIPTLSLSLSLTQKIFSMLSEAQLKKVTERSYYKHIAPVKKKVHQQQREGGNIV